MTQFEMNFIICLLVLESVILHLHPMLTGYKKAGLPLFYLLMRQWFLVQCLVPRTSLRSVERHSEQGTVHKATGAMLSGANEEEWLLFLH